MLSRLFGKGASSTSSAAAASGTPTVIKYHGKTTGAMIFDATLLAVPLVVGYFLLKSMRSQLSGMSKAEEKRQAESLAQLAAKLKRNGRPFVPITDEYENKIMADIVFPDQIRTTFDDIGGLKSIKESIHETVIIPLQNPHLFAGVEGKGVGALLSPPKGILLYGPPGTGKTMMAKAIAKDCEATFIEVRMSTLENKYFGESQKLVRALFSLAAKFAPSIIFIDEMDLFLRRRGSDNEHEVSGQMKGEFMALWDGLLSESEMNQVTIIGATNRPWDIDPAIQRRLSRQILFALPNTDERAAILKVILRPQTLAPDFNINAIAKLTDHFSGSDLTELCKYACMIPIREVIRQHREKPDSKLTSTTRIDTPARPVAMTDFVEALKHVKATGSQAFDFLKQFQSETANRHDRAASSSSHTSRPPVDEVDVD